MHGRGSMREILVGLVVVVTLVLLLALFGLAEGGPGFLTARRTIDVVFRDGQGLRVGCPVRVAGLDAGRVADIDLTEIEGTLWARVKIALPTALANKLRQDVKITIQSSLAGQSRVNVVSSGKSSVALVSGQVVRGVESTMFDPIIEQCGLGPEERGHLTHMIAEVRQTVDAVVPRVRQILGTLQETAVGFRDSADTMRPALEATAGYVQELAKRINASTPRIEAALARLDTMTLQADRMLTENRPNVQASLASVRDLTATVNDVLAKDRPKVEKLLEDVSVTRARADRVLYQSDVIAEQLVLLLTKNRANLERTMSNVRDATDWGDKLVQKLYGNPFFLSPFYKPTPEDVRAQAAFDTAQVWVKGAQELKDMLTTLDALMARASTAEQRQEIVQVQQNLRVMYDRLNQTSQLLAESLKNQSQTPVRSRR
jgi:phospholipid/cholesterol/gamma-HCH transport system substrate-binding protein